MTRDQWKGGVDSPVMQHVVVSAEGRAQRTPE